MLGFARAALRAIKTPDGATFKTVGCHHSMGPGSRNVAVFKSLKTPGAGSLRGLMVCGSVWNCPICSARITEVRRQEIEQGQKKHHADGGECQMISLTVPHYATDSLASTVSAFSAALKHLKAGRSYKQLRDRFGYVGSIRALEVTWGEANGWHPHTHDLWFTASLDDDQRKELKSQLYGLWLKACRKAGLPDPSFQHGVDVKHAYSAAEYMAKFQKKTDWGTGAELTKSHSKRGSQGRYTPFDLLAIGRADLFQEFAKAFYGQRQLYWSTGLKKRLEVHVATDAQAAEQLDIETEQTGELVVLISKPVWKAIRKGPELREAIITSAVASGCAGVLSLLRAFWPSLTLDGQTLCFPSP